MSASIHVSSCTKLQAFLKVLNLVRKPKIFHLMHWLECSVYCWFSAARIWAQTPLETQFIFGIFKLVFVFLTVSLFVLSLRALFMNFVIFSFSCSLFPIGKLYWDNGVKKLLFESNFNWNVSLIRNATLCINPLMTK